MHNILTSISLEQSVQLSLQLDVEEGKKKKGGGRPKLTIESVRQHIESFQGYRLLSTVYVNSAAKLEIICPESHTYFVNYGSFQQGKRCPDCDGNKRKTIEQVKRYIESFQGYRLLSTEYVNNYGRLEIVCPKGHLYPVRYGDFRQGKRCFECFYLSQRKTMLNGEEWKPENRKSGADQAWRKAVKNRDGYTCQVCFSPSKKLCAHHIESYAQNPALQTDLTNGITICEPCHNAFHSQYGRTTATRQNLEEFTRLKCG